MGRQGRRPRRGGGAQCEWIRYSALESSCTKLVISGSSVKQKVLYRRKAKGDELARPPCCQGRGHACAIRGKRGTQGAAHPSQLRPRIRGAQALGLVPM